MHDLETIKRLNEKAVKDAKQRAKDAKLQEKRMNNWKRGLK